MFIQRIYIYWELSFCLFSDFYIFQTKFPFLLPEQHTILYIEFGLHLFSSKSSYCLFYLILFHVESSFYFFNAFVFTWLSIKPFIFAAYFFLLTWNHAHIYSAYLPLLGIRFAIIQHILCTWNESVICATYISLASIKHPCVVHSYHYLQSNTDV